ncbi:MAG: twin-arginine translocation signal domain-containing protein, partial [Myxococcales bacterium]|nr:twin-arginine translocation signal domain-containing protein [Myxococcales bacterium]
MDRRDFMKLTASAAAVTAAHRA